LWIVEQIWWVVCNDRCKLWAIQKDMNHEIRIPKGDSSNPQQRNFRKSKIDQLLLLPLFYVSWAQVPMLST
jgi:hypothetical protein